MRRAVLSRTAVATVSAVSLTLLLGACGSDSPAAPAKADAKASSGSSAGSQGSGSQESGAKALSAAELEKVAIAQADLTTHRVAKGTKADEVPAGAIKSDKPECKPLLDAISAVPPGSPAAHVLVKVVERPAKATVAPDATEEDKARAGLDALSQPVTADLLSSYEGKGAQEAYTTLATAGKACAGGFGGDQAGEKVKITKVVPDAVTGGDEAQGWTLTMDGEGTEVVMKLAAVRKGATLAVFHTISLGGTVKTQPTGVIDAQLKKLG